MFRMNPTTAAWISIVGAAFNVGCLILIVQVNGETKRRIEAWKTSIDSDANDPVTIEIEVVEKSHGTDPRDLVPIPQPRLETNQDHPIQPLEDWRLHGSPIVVPFQRSTVDAKPFVETWQ